MEYSLLKTIEGNIGGLLLPKERFPRLSPYPASDFVNPGLGQISRLYSFYVPLYSNRNLHQVQKKNSLDNLEGTGTQQTEQKAEDEDQESPSVSEQLEKDPIDFNLQKRKRMGSPIQESFLHPKIIKTDKIFFNKQMKSEKKESKFKDALPLKPLKHKFQFADY